MALAEQSFARSGVAVGMGVAIAIAAHNVPEGIAVAEPLRRTRVSGWRCVGLAALSGLGEPLGALLAVTVLGPVVPPSMGGALAAGAMVVLAAVELIPETFSHSYVGEAAVGLLAGVGLALGLLGGPAWRSGGARQANAEPASGIRPRRTGCSALGDRAHPRDAIGKWMAIRRERGRLVETFLEQADSLPLAEGG